MIKNHLKFKVQDQAKRSRIRNSYVETLDVQQTKCPHYCHDDQLGEDNIYCFCPDCGEKLA